MEPESEHTQWETRHKLFGAFFANVSLKAVTAIVKELEAHYAVTLEGRTDSGILTSSSCLD